MAENETAQLDDEQADASGGDVEAQSEPLADAVDDRAAQLTGSAGTAATDAPVASNTGAVAEAEAHLEETDLADDRETLKKLQQQM